jgi:hypothetical protein
MEFTDIFKALQDEGIISNVFNEDEVFNTITAQYDHISKPKKYDMSTLNGIIIEDVTTNHETCSVKVRTEKETINFFVCDINEGMSADSALCAIQTDPTINVSKY